MKSLLSKRVVRSVRSRFLEHTFLAPVLSDCKHGHMMIVEHILLAAQPALEEILTPNELGRTQVDVVTTKDELVMSSANISEHLLLRVVVYDEAMRVWLYPPKDANGFTARLRSDLQDFVAESGFGWGELRG
jgi:hypothetical protein